MKTFASNLIIAAVLTYYVFSVFDGIPYNALMAIIVLIGFLIGLWLFSFFYNKSYFRKAPMAVGFLLFFFKELFWATIKVAHDVITPTHYMKPGVIAFPLDAKTDLEITLLANLISLTPGTLSIDVSDDKKTLFIHAVYIKDNDLDALKNELKNGFEKRLLQLTR
jgi:multicomponent Na+:H+ antiporter subunit E